MRVVTSYDICDDKQPVPFQVFQPGAQAACHHTVTHKIRPQCIGVHQAWSVDGQPLLPTSRPPPVTNTNYGRIWFVHGSSP
jgi:hypothetical protein